MILITLRLFFVTCLKIKLIYEIFENRFLFFSLKTYPNPLHMPDFCKTTWFINIIIFSTVIIWASKDIFFLCSVDINNWFVCPPLSRRKTKHKARGAWLNLDLVDNKIGKLSICHIQWKLVGKIKNCCVLYPWSIEIILSHWIPLFPFLFAQYCSCFSSFREKKSVRIVGEWNPSVWRSQ